MTRMTRTIGIWPPQFTMTRLCRSILLLIGLILPGLAFAEWKFYPVLRVGADFDDNANLTTRTDEVRDISGFIGEARLGILYNTTTGMFFIEPVLRSRRYSGESNLDSDDQFLNFRMNHDGTFNTLGLRGIYSRESVRTAELADADLDADIDPDEIEDDDTGQVSLRQRREKFRLVPRWRYQFSDVSAVAADVNFVTVKFEDEDETVIGLVDYTDIRARIAYERELSARNTGLIVATARNYQTDFLDGDFSGYGLSAGFNRALSETSTFRALLGVEKAEQINVSQEDPHFVADISLVRRQETTRLLLQYRRRISASGRGSLATRNEFNLRFVRDLNDRFAAGIGARAYETTRLGTVENETRYVQLNAQLIWRFSEAISIQANYRHSVIDRDIIGESANSNRLTIWFNYEPNSRSKILFVR